MDNMNLVGGLEHVFLFPYIGNDIPNWLFFRGVEATNQKKLFMGYWEWFLWYNQNQKEKLEDAQTRAR